MIKPYIGGGFGNKQDVLYEPLNAWLATLVGGRPVRLEISREETQIRDKDPPCYRREMPCRGDEGWKDAGKETGGI